MATLNTKQSQFLTDYTMMLLTDEINEKLEALRETDEWKNAIEEGKKDKEILASVGKFQVRLEDSNRITELNKELQNLNEKHNWEYLVATTTWDGGLREPSHSTMDESEIKNRVEEVLDTRVLQYALAKTGFVKYIDSWGKPYNDLQTEVRARLAITNLGNFDEIVEGVLSRFDTDKVVQVIVDRNKDISEDQSVQEVTSTQS